MKASKPLILLVSLAISLASFSTSIAAPWVTAGKLFAEIADVARKVARVSGKTDHQADDICQEVVKYLLESGKFTELQSYGESRRIATIRRAVNNKLIDEIRKGQTQLEHLQRYAGTLRKAESSHPSELARVDEEIERLSNYVARLDARQQQELRIRLRQHRDGKSFEAMARENGAKKGRDEKKTFDKMSKELKAILPAGAIGVIVLGLFLSRNDDFR